MQKKDRVYYENLAKISESHTVEQLEEIIITHWNDAKQEIDDELDAESNKSYSIVYMTEEEFLSERKERKGFTQST